MLAENIVLSTNPPLRLRKASHQDLKFINELSYSEMDPIVNIAWRGRFRWQSWFKDIEKAIDNSSHMVYIIQEANSSIGYLWMNEERTTLWITAIVLITGYQRKKIGTKIILYLIKECKKTNLNSIELGVQQNNSEAIQFYVAMGFKKFDQIRSAHTDLLRLELKEPSRLTYT
ncbi:MAG: GNAT family N-acetyltransferase [Candidatus Hodarchaeales archaeon]